MRAFTRFGAVIIFAIVALVSTILLLFSRSISTRLENFGLGPYSWDWSDTNDTQLAVVVFGDSWVDDGVMMEKQGDDGFKLSSEPSRKSKLQGLSWTEVLCKELKCTSYHNFASSSPITVENPPSGVLTSNSLYESTVMLPEVTSTYEPSLPDLAAQIAAYHALASTIAPVKTLFVFSFGIWDVYHYSMLSLSKEKSEEIASSSLDILFTQLDDLFDLFADHTENALTDEEQENEKNTVHDFQVVIPNLIDPTFLPGWRSSRPTPLAPTSFAEEQKIAVGMVTKWNSYMEDKIKDWKQDKPAPARPSATPTSTATPSADSKKEDKKDEDKTVDGSDETKEEGDDDEDEVDDLPSLSLLWQKTIHRPDLGTYFFDSLRTKYLQEHKIIDHNGLGGTLSPYESTSMPCAPVAGFQELKKSKKTKRSISDALGTRDGSILGGGSGEEKNENESKFEEVKEPNRDSCGDAEKWLFWDEWDLGPRAQKDMGKDVGKLIQEENKNRVGMMSYLPGRALLN